MREIGTIEFGYITALLEYNDEDKMVTISYDFGEYAPECHYAKDRMENELEFIWDEVCEKVTAETGRDLGNLVKNNWPDDDQLVEHYTTF